MRWPACSCRSRWRARARMTDDDRNAGSTVVPPLRVGTSRSPRRRGGVRMVQRPTRARVGVTGHGAVKGHHADRAVGVRQVDVPAHPQSDARGGARSSTCRLGQAGRDRHLWSRSTGHGDSAAHRHGVPEAESIPGHDHRRKCACRPQVLPDQPGRPRRPRRGVTDQGGPVERGQGSARRARGRPLRRSATAPLHRPGTGGQAASAAHGRAVLCPRPHVHPAHRGAPSTTSQTRSRWSS